jgi:FtsP/CotA-like multicopper oxidase with cupredoxin domain
MLIIIGSGSVAFIEAILLQTKQRHQPEGAAGYEWSGFGCDRNCSKGDVNYIIQARLEQYTMPRSADAAPGLWNSTAAMFTRTFVGASGGPYCRGENGEPYDGSSGPLGPCLTVRPGQTMTIRVENRMDGGMGALGQRAVSNDDYWQAASTYAQSLDNVRVGPQSSTSGWFGAAPSNASAMRTFGNDFEDLPGRARGVMGAPGGVKDQPLTFDDVNLHLHGMQVVPHLFYPQGTSDPTSPWITIKPASEDPSSSCFCYVFYVPPDHPQGTFFYHIHRHGSTAMQGWQGMLGMLIVGGADSTGSPEHDLRSQGVSREIPFVMWEWSVEPIGMPDEPLPNTYREGQFIDGGGAAQTFPVNNGFRPTYDLLVNETVHLRMLCAQTTTGSAVYMLDESGAVVPFHVFASDGISYGRAYEKPMVVIGVGQREGVLVQFSTPGLVRIMQGVINDFQSTGENVGPGPNSTDRPMAFLNVTLGGEPQPRVDPSLLHFTPGMGSSSVRPSQISSELAVNFEVRTQLDRMPTPQFVINGREFDYDRIETTVDARGAAQWTLTSNMNYFHPFHVHVNPFQVKSMFAGYLPGSPLFRRAVTDTNLVPEGMWRDTIFIPPMGNTVIWNHFGNGRRNAWQGKTVFHCHFLDHEDQGMIKAFLIDAGDNKFG